MGVFEQIDTRLTRIEDLLGDLLASVPAESAKAEPEIEPEYMSTVQAAEFLGVSKQSLALWRSESKGPTFVRVGNIVRYSRQDLRDWMDDHRKEAR